MVSGDFAREAKVRDVATGKEINTFHNFGASAALSPDGQCVAFSLEGGIVHVSNAATGKEILRPFRAHDAPVVSIAYSPDGRRLATASWDRTTKIWDATTGRQLRVLRGHDHFLQYLVFSA